MKLPINVIKNETKLQIANQSCHGILYLFKKSANQSKNENMNSGTRPVSVSL